MKLSTFEGGLSTRLDPTLVNPNEGIAYSNINNKSALLSSALGPLASATEARGYFYFYNSEWINSDAYRTYIEYQNILYYTEINQKPRKYNGFLDAQLGIDPPLDALTTVQANPVASEKISASPSTLQYTYTYYNVDYDIESVPAPLSDELSLAADKVVDITDLTLSLDNQVSHVRIYRIGDGITTMTLVMEIEVASVSEPIRDDIETVNLPGALLDSYNNYPPPIDLSNIVEAYGILFGTSGTRLYFSTIGEPDYWPAANFVEFASDLTGLQPVPDGILVQSRFKTDILIGTSSANFAKLPVSRQQGCIDHLTNQEVNSVPVWVSTDGIVKYESGRVSVLSRDKLDKLSLSVINTVVYDEVYYVLKTDGSILAMDARFGLIFKNFDFEIPIENIAVADDVLYVGILEKLNTLFAGDELALTYLSPEFTENDHAVTKLYNNVYIKNEGDFVVKVYIDGIEILHKVLNKDQIYDLKIPQEKQRGSKIQFLVTGTGKIYEIEYKVVGRQNGR